MNEIWEWVELITIARTSMSWTNNAMNGMNEIWEWVELITIARTSYAPPLVPTAPCSFLKSLMWRCSRIHLVLWLQRTRVSKFVTSTNSQITWWIASGIPRWWTARRREMLFHIGGTILQAIHLLICLIHVLVLSVSQCVCVCNYQSIGQASEIWTPWTWAIPWFLHMRCLFVGRNGRQWRWDFAREELHEIQVVPWPNGFLRMWILRRSTASLEVCC